MKGQFNFLINTIFRLLVLLGLYFLLRVAFYFFQYNQFGTFTFWQGLMIIKGGLFFDLSALLYFNSLFIVASLLPFTFRKNRGYRIFLEIDFYLFNIIALIIAISDIEYYGFNNKRLTSDVLLLLPETGGLISKFIYDYWYLLALFILAVLALIFVNRRIAKPVSEVRNHWLHLVIFIIGIPLMILGMRGGFSYRPLGAIDAADYAQVRFTSLVTCSPFTFIQSMTLEEIKEKHYFSKSVQDSIYTIHHKFQLNSHKKKENIVIIILESMSSEYIGAMGSFHGYTPFLDSIVRKSYSYKHSFSNAERSKKGIPAVLASIPALMDDAFTSSTFQGNCFIGLGSCLKEMGYQTAFFHGGSNGTMNFDAFTKAAGFDLYFGRKEFNNDQYYDGKWGIYDEEFLQFTVNKLSTLHQPFCGTLFTLTLHDPFLIPSRYKGHLKKGPHEELEIVNYVDHALFRFFATASKTDWYNNTLFIITADHPFKIKRHSDPSNDIAYKQYSIPIIFYKPNGSIAGRDSGIAQQIDIMPTVLDYVGYNKPFNAFGLSLFKKKQNVSYQFANGIYQLCDTSHILFFNGDRTIGYYNFVSDPELKNNLAEKPDSTLSLLENKLKAIIQTFNGSMIHNSLCIVEK